MESDKLVCTVDTSLHPKVDLFFLHSLLLATEIDTVEKALQNVRENIGTYHNQ